jgi:hypothetical protein
MGIEDKSGLEPYIVEYVYKDTPPAGDFSVKKITKMDEHNVYTISDSYGRTFEVVKTSRGRPVGCFVLMKDGSIGASFVSDEELCYNRNIKKKTSVSIALGRAIMAKVGLLSFDKTIRNDEKKDGKRHILIPYEYQEQYDAFVARAGEHFKGGK